MPNSKVHTLKIGNTSYDIEDATAKQRLDSLDGTVGGLTQLVGSGTLNVAENQTTILAATNWLAAQLNDQNDGISVQLENLKNATIGTNNVNSLKNLIGEPTDDAQQTTIHGRLAALEAILPNLPSEDTTPSPSTDSSALWEKIGDLDAYDDTHTLIDQVIGLRDIIDPTKFGSYNEIAYPSGTTLLGKIDDLEALDIPTFKSFVEDYICNSNDLEATNYDTSTTLASKIIPWIQNTTFANLDTLATISDSDGASYISTILNEEVTYLIKDAELRAKVNNLIEIVNSIVQGLQLISSGGTPESEEPTNESDESEPESQEP